jgi:nicotinamidase-related amidase
MEADAPHSGEHGEHVTADGAEANRGGSLEARRTALVVVDMTNSQVVLTSAARELTGRTHAELDYFDRRVNDVVIPNIRRMAPALRAAGGLVTYVRIGTNCPDLRDVVPALRPWVTACGAREGQPECDVIDELALESGDVNMLKPGSGGFAGTSLDAVLRNAGIAHVLYTGVVSNACVMLTACAGFDLGYDGWFIRDATATFSQSAQEATEALLGVYVAEIVDTEVLIQRL